MSISYCRYKFTNNSRHTQGEIVTVRVGSGDELQTFYLHASLLEKHAAYFSALLNQDQPEVNNTTILLPKDNPRAFQVFVDWVYNKGKLDERRHMSDDLVEVWVLANKLGCPRLQDQAMTMLKTYHVKNRLRQQKLILVQEAGLSDSQLMKYLIEEAGCRLSWDNSSVTMLKRNPILKDLEWDLLVDVMGHLRQHCKYEIVQPCKREAGEHEVGKKRVAENTEGVEPARKKSRKDSR